MNIDFFLQVMDVAEKLKCNTRHSWTSNGRHESVADHSWRLCLMAFLVQDEYPKLDMNRVIEMCIIHDLGEAFTGDIPSFEKTAAHEAEEDRQMTEWVNTFPDFYRKKLTALLDEMNAQITDEAKLYKTLDNLEAVIQHNEADIKTWLPLEYDLQLAYGAERATFSPYTMALKNAINQQTLQKIDAEKNEVTTE